ncbi:GIY-YIG nuclease family protein [Geofilum sp. OHC36d9]|uniref:GIY-YIG nuclease family protein n=1 Tax=Geofilum sp. OHC36d9 TaxID=3458413 RepID=UPI004033F2D8
MAEQTFNQEHDGYWREPNKSGLPKESGVYFVYECTHNVADKTVTIHKLIYIGESDNANNRVANHEKTDDWKKHVRQGKVLCFGFTPVDDYSRVRVEAAYINHHKPVENTECVNNFPFHKTNVNTSGKNKFIDSSFTVG